ncbi:MAG: hypothetical protein V1835_00480 [Candidatus Micrarchaeota archaeon]
MAGNEKVKKEIPAHMAAIGMILPDISDAQDRGTSAYALQDAGKTHFVRVTVPEGLGKLPITLTLIRREGVLDGPRFEVFPTGRIKLDYHLKGHPDRELTPNQMVMLLKLANRAHSVQIKVLSQLKSRR